MGRRERLSCCGGTNVADNREIGSCHLTEFAKPKTCESWACPGRSRHRLVLPSKYQLSSIYRHIEDTPVSHLLACSKLCCHPSTPPSRSPSAASPSPARIS